MLKECTVKHPNYGSTIDDSTPHLQIDYNSEINSSNPQQHSNDKEEQKISLSETNSCISGDSLTSGNSIQHENRIVRSIQSDDLQKRRRFVLKYPDGTYSHAFKNGDTDSWMEVKYNDTQRQGIQSIQILQIEDEVEFLINNIEFILEPESAMKSYLQRRKILFCFMILSLIFEVLLYAYLINNMDYIISQLSEIYKELSIEKLQKLFQLSNGIDIAINIFMYSFGFYAIITHKVTYFNVFHSILILAVFSRIIISYLNMYFTTFMKQLWNLD